MVVFVFRGHRHFADWALCVSRIWTLDVTVLPPFYTLDLKHTLLVLKSEYDFVNNGMCVNSQREENKGLNGTLIVLKMKKSFKVWRPGRTSPRRIVCVCELISITCKAVTSKSNKTNSNPIRCQWEQCCSPVHQRALLCFAVIWTVLHQYVVGPRLVSIQFLRIETKDGHSLVTVGSRAIKPFPCMTGCDVHSNCCVSELIVSLSAGFPGRRRKSSHKPLVLSEACKQLLIYRLPQVLRLHLKRFRQVPPQPSFVPVVSGQIRLIQH